MKTDDTLLQALRRKDSKAIEFVYWNFFASIRNYIVVHGGTPQDAEDVFQDALLVVLSKLSQPDFVLQSSLKTYHFAICKNMWKSRLRQSRAYSEGIQTQVEESHWEEAEETLEHKWNSMEVVLKRITHFCSKFLTDLFLDGKLPHHYKNEHTFHNQKYKCLLQARKAAKKIKHIMGDLAVHTT